MRRLPCLLIVLLTWTSVADAKRTPIDPRTDPNRPENFSNIVGKYDIRVSADPTPTIVHVEDPITLRIEIFTVGKEAARPATIRERRQRKRDEPSREHLRVVPESLEKDFYVKQMPSEDRADRVKKTWLFVYRLKPRHVKVESIHGLALVYYDPDFPGFKKEPADQIKVTVKPRPELPDVDIDVDAVLASFYAASGDVLARAADPVRFTLMHLVLLLGIPPLACVLGAMAWRRYFPDEAQVALRVRQEAARRASAELRVGGSACVVVCRYLHERFNFPVHDPTPAEVFAFLKRRGFALVLCAQCQALFQACDALRFTTGAPPEPRVLIDDAMHLIKALEADPCARG